jgi:hypothetical protein
VVKLAYPLQKGHNVRASGEFEKLEILFNVFACMFSFMNFIVNNIEHFLVQYIVNLDKAV